MDYKQKYLKYKQKYIALKNSLKGGMCNIRDNNCILDNLHNNQCINIECLIQKLKEINESYGIEIETIIQSIPYKYEIKLINEIIALDNKCTDSKLCRSNIVEYNTLIKKFESKIYQIKNDKDTASNMGKLLLVIAPNYHIFKRDLITVDVDYSPAIKPSENRSPTPN